MEDKKTAVLGASPNPNRYAYRAVAMLTNNGHSVVALGKRNGNIFQHQIITDWPNHIPDLHTLTLYIGPQNQPPLYEYIVNLAPKRIIFNPGTENPELETLAQKKGIQTLHACTLVMLSVNNY